MESKAKRTLVKSRPELWELADDVGRMEAWMAGLVGTGEAVPVEVTRRDPQRALAWRADGSDEPAQIAIELEDGGFGTAVEVTARRAPHPELAERALQLVLDELGGADRRRFSRG